MIAYMSPSIVNISICSSCKLKLYVGVKKYGYDVLLNYETNLVETAGDGHTVDHFQI